jgi:tetraacyldisaccharide 4'-kinase
VKGRAASSVPSASFTDGSDVNPLSAFYGQVARFRRTWYERRPHLRRQLGCPVISVGNLVVGGSGKTPVVAAVAQLLREAGYAPAVLSRGYARRNAQDGVVVVSDGRSVVAPVESSGDEPQMLARTLTGVPVLVSPDRSLSGTLAQRQFGANVVVLDDGFQHLQVGRTVDLLLMSEQDVQEPLLPAGRLREPTEAARHADALLVPEGGGDARGLARRFGIADAFTVSTTMLPPRLVTPFGEPVTRTLRRVVAVAGIARPQRFFTGLRTAGYDIVEEIAFRDHRWFTRRDVDRIAAAVVATNADGVLTTEKDAVRLEKCGRGSLNEDTVLAYVPIVARVEPAEAFRSWLLDRIGGASLRQGALDDRGGASR